MATYNGHNEDASGNILLSIGNGMTATLETGTTASQAYTKGAYLYYNNRLCKVTSAIASGNTLTIGTNIAYTTLGEELTSHLKATNGDEFYFDYKDGEPGYYPSASKTASEFVPIGGTEEPVEILACIGGYKGFINNKTLVMNWGSGTTLSGNYVSIKSNSSNNNLVVTALQSCKIKMWKASSAGGTGTYTETELATGATITSSKLVGLVEVYEP